jgi:hypothetical protein
MILCLIITMNSLNSFGATNLIPGTAVPTATSFTNPAYGWDYAADPTGLVTFATSTATSAEYLISLPNQYNIINPAGADISTNAACYKVTIYGSRDGVNWLVLGSADGNTSSFRTFNFEINTWYNQLKIHYDNYLSTIKVSDLKIYSTGPANFSFFDGIGIGTTTLTDNLDIAGNAAISAIYDINNRAYYMDLNSLYISINTAGQIRADSYYDIVNPNYFLDPNNTGISLKVAGKIETPEIEVKVMSANSVQSKSIITDDLNVKVEDVADYVFDADYKLKGLDEVENYVRVNKHLPEIPAASEIQKKGMNVAEMNNLLLKKVEELTLYVVNLNKQLQDAKSEIARIKADK